MITPESHDADQRRVSLTNFAALGGSECKSWRYSRESSGQGGCVAG
jgi:hypothetical protein